MPPQVRANRTRRRPCRARRSTTNRSAARLRPSVSEGRDAATSSSCSAALNSPTNRASISAHACVRPEVADRRPLRRDRDRVHDEREHVRGVVREREVRLERVGGPARAPGSGEWPRRERRRSRSPCGSASKSPPGPCPEDPTSHVGESSAGVSTAVRSATARSPCSPSRDIRSAYGCDCSGSRRSGRPGSRRRLDGETSGDEIGVDVPTEQHVLVEPLDRVEVPPETELEIPRRVKSDPLVRERHLVEMERAP